MTVRNRKEQTVKCIESIQKQTVKDIHTVVVDDGSTDGTKDEIQSRFPEVTVLAGEGNLWFTGGMRKAIEHVKGISSNEDSLLFMNDDTVLTENFVEQLLKTLGNEKKCVGSVAKSSVDNSDMYVIHEQLKGITTPQVREYTEGEVIQSECINTRGTLVSMKLIEEIGSLSKWFPHYGSDYNFFYRAKRAGYELLVDTNAVLYSQDDDKGLSGRIREKEKITFGEFFKLFFNRRSAFNLYSRTLLVILHTPFPEKILTVSRILLSMPYIFLTKVLF